MDEEVQIVQQRVEQLGPLELPNHRRSKKSARHCLRELRDGVTADGKTKLKSPSATLSTAEAIE
jgi:hypothetical protein